MLTLLRRGLQPVILAAFLLFSTPNSQAQDKKVSSGTLKLGFLMDSLKVERWQTDLDKFQKRAAELRAEVLVETADGTRVKSVTAAGDEFPEKTVVGLEVSPRDIHLFSSDSRLALCYGIQ